MTYQIIATLGPASADETTWRDLLSAGATGFRINTSHMRVDEITAWMERLQAAFSQRPISPSITLDLQGSKWRLGEFPACALADGEQVRLILGPQSTAAHSLPVPHADFFQAAAAAPGEILLNDGRLALRIESAQADQLLARVLRGGPITPRKGVTLPGSDFHAVDLGEKDRAIVRQTGGFAQAVFAVSYIQDAQEMQRYRALIPALAGRPAALIAKLERASAMQGASAIAAFADGLWVCRGDLGAELGLPGMAEAVHQISSQVRKLPVPVLLAGQVFEHLTAHPNPTRSEVCCLYDALTAGYQGVVLSDETAVGADPRESCRAAAMFQTRQDAQA